jgi:chaperonin cofactor prefoldin
MDLLITTIIGFAGATAGAIVMALINRSQTRANVAQTAADTRKTEGENRQADSDYLWAANSKLTARLDTQEESLRTTQNTYETEMKKVAAAQVVAQEKYEERISDLHAAMELVSSELARANKQLEAATTRISELQAEVKANNTVITGLQDRIIDLLNRLGEKAMEKKEDR